MAIVAAGPRPGRTPMSMPRVTPRRQNSRFAGCSTTSKPPRASLRISIPGVAS
jgi:hypothetical protein